MPSINVNSSTASLIEGALDLLEGKSLGARPSKPLPLWNPDGTEVKTTEELAVAMGKPLVVAAHYAIEAKDADADLINDAMNIIEEKVVRHVRTPAGAKRFGQPIGSIIVRDGASPLKNLKIADNDYDDVDSVVKGSNGKNYLIVKEGPKKWTAISEEGTWDDIIVDGAVTQEDVLTQLDAKVGGKKGPIRKMPPGKVPTGAKNPQESVSIKRPAWFPKNPNPAQEELAKYIDSIEGENPGIWKSRDTQSSFRKIEKLKADEQAEYDRLSPKGKKRYIEDIAEHNGDHTAAFQNALHDAETTQVQRNTLNSLDTMVRDRYWDMREEGESHTDARMLAVEADKIYTRDDFTRADYNELNKRIRAVGRAQAYRELIEKNKKPKSGSRKADSVKFSKPKVMAMASVKPGDYMTTTESESMFRHAPDHNPPQKVVKVGPITKTGKVTVYLEDGSKVTRSSRERVNVRTRAEGN